MLVGTGVLLGVGVSEGGNGVSLGVWVGVSVGVKVGMRVSVGVGVDVGVGVGRRRFRRMFLFTSPPVVLPTVNRKVTTEPVTLVKSQVATLVGESMGELVSPTSECQSFGAASVP